MVGAYFSLLEHTLVLVTPFIHQAPLGQDLLRFIGDKWSAKFKATVGLKDATAKRLYDELGRVSEEYRNTFAHGGFDKSRATIGFRIPGAGWLPAILSDIRDSPHFDFVPGKQADYAAICKLFDEVDEWLENGTTEFGMVWLKAGLDVSFDAEFRVRFEQSLKDDEFTELVERTSYYVDLHANMDY